MMLKMTFFDQIPHDLSDGYGDSTYIEFPNGQNMLIDVSTELGGDAVLKSLLAMGVEQIDYFVASHLHKDHTGGFGRLAERIAVKEIILSGYGYKSIEADKAFPQIADERGIPVRQVRMGDEFHVGDVCLQVLFPPRGIPEVSPELSYVEQEINSNVYSMVLRMTYKGFSALFAGDIYEETEKQLILTYGDSLRSTLLKVPHHGNDTSSGQAFLDAVKPQLAVMMGRCCEWPVQLRFANAGIPLYGTLFDGTIAVQTDGAMLKAICGKGEREYRLTAATVQCDNASDKECGK